VLPASASHNPYSASGSGSGKPIKKRDHNSINCRDPAHKVYLATVVTLISAMLLGTTPARLARLSAMPGIDRRTLARWRTWWRSTFTDGPFASVAKAALVPPLDIAGLPVSLLDRFAGDIEQKLTALLRFLGPLTGGASAMHAF
jgi:hypothetical protein